MRRHIIVGSIGAVLGWAVLALLAANPSGMDAAHFIAPWDTGSLEGMASSARVLDLSHEAVALRVGMAFIDSGFWFGFLPFLFGIWLVMLSDMGKKSQTTRTFSLVLWVTIVCSSVIFFFLEISAISVALLGGGQDPLHDAIGKASCNTYTAAGIASGIFLFAFLCALVIVAVRYAYALDKPSSFWLQAPKTQSQDVDPSNC